MTPAERIEDFGGAIHADLSAFFAGEFERHQRASLTGLDYLSPLLVDFDGSLSDGWAETLEMMEDQGLDADARESVTIDGREHTPIAWLFASSDAEEPEPAYLVMDVANPAAAVYLADPSGGSEKVADSFAAFVDLLVG